MAYVARYRSQRPKMLVICMILIARAAKLSAFDIDRKHISEAISNTIDLQDNEKEYSA